MLKGLLGIGLILVGLTAFDFLAPEAAARMGLTLERTRCGLEAKTATIGDMEIAYLEGGPTGEGVETLVLIHGFGGDKDNFTRVAAFLTDRFHVVIPDLAGFGDSTRLMDAKYDIRSQTERLHEVLQGMGINEFWMGGNSMGGALTISYAALYPDEVKGTWLLAPGGVAGSELTDVFVEYEKSGEYLLVAEQPEDFDRILDLVVEKRPFMTYSVKHVLAQRAVSDFPLHKRIFDELIADLDANKGINEAASQVQAPSLIVWGKLDRTLHYSGAGILDNLVPNSELIVMEDIGHVPMLEAPKRAADDFLAFVDRQQ